MFSIFSKYSRNPPCNIWFILGPSGVGKTHVSHFVAEQKNWLHLEIDQFSIQGIDSYDIEGTEFHDLRLEWDIFRKLKLAKPLIKKIIRKYEEAGKAGAILSFPSTIVLSLAHIKRLAREVEVIYLFGEQEFCINSFLQREDRLKRGLGLSTWQGANRSMYLALSDPRLQLYAVNVFNEDGTYKPATTISDHISSKLRKV